MRPSVAFLFLSLGLAAAAPPPPPKHVIFFVVDDLGFSDLSYKMAPGNPWNLSSTLPIPPTPHIDALALGGVRLESTYVHYLCSPSRTAFLSGRYAYTTGMNMEVIVDGVPDQLPTNIRTVADHLQAHNWSTSAFGKWDAGATSWGCSPNCRGFDYFSGFFNADNDYYSHRPGPYLDLRVNFEPDANETGVYETTLITGRVQDWITRTVAAKGPDSPTFAYVAHQAIHGPQQVPQSYIDGFCTDSIGLGSPVRVLACGQVRSVDESLANITATYKALGIWDETIVIFTTDNGGNTDTGGSNWPLRGNKATMFEGGMRAAAFVSGAGLAPSVLGSANFELYSLVDWMPTIVHGIAGIDLAEASVPKYPYQPAPPPLDGVDVWASISQGLPSPRTEALLNLAPNGCWDNGSQGCDIPGSGAIRVGNYKLLWGHAGVWQIASKGNVSMNSCAEHDNLIPGSTFPLNVTSLDETPPFCPTGWVPPPGSGLGIQPPPDVPACWSGGKPSLPCSTDGTPYLSGVRMLFDVVNDPLETTDLAAQHPDIVQALLAKLQAYNATNIPQAHSAVDPASDPAKFGGVWTPWRGNPIPSVCDPNTTAPNGTGILHSNFDSATFVPSASSFEAVFVGWAWSSAAADGGRAPLDVTFFVDHVPLGTFVANVSRPGLVPKTGAPDPDHGFDSALLPALVANATAGKHTFAAFAADPAQGGALVQITGSPKCLCSMVECAC
jgi:arylsulfatase B